MPKAAWPIVPLTARVAADHFDERPRDAFLKLLDKLKDKLVDQSTQDGPLPGGLNSRRAAVVKSKEEASWAGSDKILSKAVINARHASAGASVAARKRVYGDPRTLYGKGGGVFGLARLSHELMEAWMADPVLNRNEMVARWHESQQKVSLTLALTPTLTLTSILTLTPNPNPKA